VKNVWDLLGREIEDHYKCIRDRPIIPEVSVQQIRYHLRDRYGDFAHAIPLRDVFEDVTRMLREWQLHVTHPRYFGLFNPSVQPASIVADSLVAAYNPQLAAWSHSPAANEIERFTLDFLAAQIGYDPAASSACFTTGGAEANQSGVLVALTHMFPAVRDEGVAVLPARPLLYLSEESHHSFEKIVHACGLGRRSLRMVPVDATLRLDIKALRTMVQEDRERGDAPFLVVATVGTTGAGIIDPLVDIVAVCRQEQMWCHADAAWGGAACLSPELKTHLAGLAETDSVTWDAHKWLTVPMGAGMFFCRHKESVARTFGTATPYMPEATADTTDPYLTTMQWSRRFIGLKLFMTLAELGLGGYRQAIDFQARMGRELKAGLLAKGWRVVNETPLPVVCFTHPRLECGDVSVADVLAAVRRRNIWISDVRLAGAVTALRACITSFKTNEEDVAALIEALEQAVA